MGGMRLQGRVQLSCGHVDIGRMIMQCDNPNQGFFCVCFWVRGGGGEMGAG